MSVPVIPVKPRALSAASRLAIIAPASPGRVERCAAGVAELRRLGFSPLECSAMHSEGYFAGSADARRTEFVNAVNDPSIEGIVALRGGYGSVYLLPEMTSPLDAPKVLLGFSDLTTLQMFLWEKHRWVGFHGPMVAAGFDGGAGNPNGYDHQSFIASVQNSTGGWDIPLAGESLREGQADGTILGGCLTLLESTIGTPWELRTQDSILLLEDRAMKPYQVDRVLMHLLLAGKFDRVRGIILGEFPESDPPVAGSPSVRDVCTRILAPLNVPVVFGAAVGHTSRPMLTIPLGVQARMIANGAGELQILEPAVRS